VSAWGLPIQVPDIAAGFFPSTLRW